MKRKKTEKKCFKRISNLFSEKRENKKYGPGFKYFFCFDPITISIGHFKQLIILILCTIFSSLCISVLHFITLLRQRNEITLLAGYKYVCVLLRVPIDAYRLTAAGYLCYLRSIHRIIDESHRLPWRDELLKMSPQRLSIVVLLVFVTVVLLKAYAIGIVWRCYKYLTMRQHNIRSMLPYIIPEISTHHVSISFYLPS